ncbi:hypothetical protein OROGR_000203 [Orobanche gracilis]
MSRRRQLFGDNTPSDGDVGGTSSDQGNEFSEGVENHQNRDSGVLIPKIGMEFQTENDAYEFDLAYAEKVGFSVRKHKSYTDKDKNLLSRKFCCSAEGKRPNDERDLYVKKHRAETRFGCEAMMRIYRKNGKFELTEFVEEHNHYLASPNKVHLLRSHRKISPAAAMQIEMAHKVGIAPKASHDLLVEQFGGRENVGFISEDYKNYLRSKRSMEIEKGDTGGILEYLHKRQLEDSNFVYAIQVDEDDMMTNIFWADAKMRNDYSNYGDVVCFDTTYRKNGEGRPLAIFVGVNNHKQTAVFGVALLYDKTTESFEWLFDTFSKAMFEKKPQTILTDEDAAMAKALASTWPSTNHRLCIWHIYQNAARHLSSVFSQFKEFSRDFNSCVYDFEEEEEFLEAWNEMLEKYNLQGNDWLKTKFRKKEKWALLYGRSMFCADMTTTQRSESMNSVVKRYVSYQHNFRQFFTHFNRLIDDRRYNELRADLMANVSTPVLASPVSILKHAASVYTPAVFKSFQIEWNKSHDPGFDINVESDTITRYDIKPVKKNYFHSVTYDSSVDEVQCSCRKLFAGILCSHILKVFSLRNILEIPSKYILKRWTRKAKTGYCAEKISKIDEAHVEKKDLYGMRYKNLCAISTRLINRAAERGDSYKIVEGDLIKLLEKIDEMLQNEENVEHVPISQNAELTECSLPEVDIIDGNENITLDESNIKGVKKKKKPVSGKRLKSALEKNTRRGKKKSPLQTDSTPTAPSNVQALHGGNDNNNFPNNAPMTGMTNLLLGQHFGSTNMFMEQPSASQNVAAQMYTQPTMFHSNLREQRPLAFGRFMEQTQSSMIHSNHGEQSPFAFGRGMQQSLPQVLGVSSSLGFSRFRTQSPIGLGTPYGNSDMAICSEQCGCSLPCVGGMSCFCYREK